MSNLDEFIKDAEKMANERPDNPVEPVIYTTKIERGVGGISSGRRPDKFCFHNKKRLDNELRFVVCQQCGGCLDPYDVLLRLVRDNENIWWTAKRKEEEIGDLFKRAESLKKELASLNGKIKRRKESLNRAEKE